MSARTTPETTTASERLEARIPRATKALLVKAAALQGSTLTDFVLASAADAARRVIRDHEVLELSARDQAAFAADLLDPPEPTPLLREAARRYRRAAR
jgi:uncharacterized protein (DUF1778 family)